MVLPSDLVQLKAQGREKLSLARYRLRDPIRDREESWQALVAAARGSLPKGYMDAIDLEACKSGFLHTCSEWRLAAALPMHWTIETRWLKSAGHWVQGEYSGQAADGSDGVRGRFHVLRITPDRALRQPEHFADLGTALVMAEMGPEEGAPF